MADEINVSFVAQHLNISLFSNNDDQQITLQARDRVSIFLNDKITPSQINLEGGGGTAWLPAADLCDDLNSTYFYFGWLDVVGGWLIRRAHRTTLVEVDATISANPSYANLTLAWADKSILSYT